MDIKNLEKDITVSGQISSADVAELAERGVKHIICNRPDGEGNDQPGFEEISEEAGKYGIQCHYQPVISGRVSDEDADTFRTLIDGIDEPVHLYCRSGMRCTTLWALANGKRRPLSEIVRSAAMAGYDMVGVAARIEGSSADQKNLKDYDVLIVGGGAGGIATASSLLARCSDLKIGIIDPADVHYYQPGWTFVGGGIFQPETTAKTMASLIPRGVEWIKSAVASFDPDSNRVLLEGCRWLAYKQLVVAPGIKLNWEGIEGLTDTLGQNGVTSNYRYDLAPYTWELVQNLKNGRAVFTQPPMPIKCAGAPQKAMYLSADHWFRQGVINNIDIQFYNAGAVLFGVEYYVPSLMKYIEKYDANLNFNHKLVKIDGPAKRAWFETPDESGGKKTVETEFDMIHVVPPQIAPDFIRSSPLADEAGWVDVDQNTLQHKKFENIWSLGDAMNAPNAKTMAAARKQAPVVANNLLAKMGKAGYKDKGIAHYDGYGSCPLTVERGKIVLAEFGYGGKLLPSFPQWLINGQKPSRLAWLLKERILPPLYWKGMLRGKEWMASPVITEASSAAAQSKTS